MDRTLEPELMEDPAQARAYAAADFAAADARFVEAFLALAPELGLDPARPARVVDLGCGPAGICARLAAARPGLAVVGVDGAAAMLAQAGPRPARVALVCARLQAPPFPARAFDAVVSNSLLHHLHAPADLWAAVARLGRPGAPVLVGDLFRPDTPEAARRIVAEHAGGEDPLLQRDFLLSLHAACTPDEVRAQLRAAGLERALAVEVVSDRHLFVRGRLPHEFH